MKSLNLGLAITAVHGWLESNNASSKGSHYHYHYYTSLLLLYVPLLPYFRRYGLIVKCVLGIHPDGDQCLSFIEEIFDRKFTMENTIFKGIILDAQKTHALRKTAKLNQTY